MPGPKRRIYWRDQGRGPPRAYADLRDYAGVGGRREPLICPGEKLATTDADVAQVLLADRLRLLEEARRTAGLTGHHATATSQLAPYAQLHLEAKLRSGKVTEQWLASTQRHLERAVAFFGAERELASIGVVEVRKWIELLRQTPSRKGGSLTDGVARHHLNSLSNLYRRAGGEGVVLPGFNPAAAVMEKPSAAPRHEAQWLEVPDATLLLEATQRQQLRRADLAVPYLHELVATFLLTGGRRLEVFGLEVSDVNFERKTVTFRPNRWRRLKTPGSHRVVPLWPQLEAILRPYLNRRAGEEIMEGQAARVLLFPSPKPGPEQMLWNFQKALDQVGGGEGWGVTPKVFRHTYCTARLQTLDGGAPVSIFTVGRELGHGGESLVRRVYGHLGQHRHRAEVVEYRQEGSDAAGVVTEFGTNSGTNPIEQHPDAVSASAVTSARSSAG